MDLVKWLLVLALTGCVVQPYDYVVGEEVAPPPGQAEAVGVLEDMLREDFSDVDIWWFEPDERGCLDIVQRRGDGVCWHGYWQEDLGVFLMDRGSAGKSLLAHELLHEYLNRQGYSQGGEHDEPHWNDLLPDLERAVGDL